jgi:[ribosomal protein S5]-alanine N-acetyltransferase
MDIVNAQRDKRILILVDAPTHAQARIARAASAHNGQSASMRMLTTPRLVLEPRMADHAVALYPLLADPCQREFHDDDPVSLEALRERFRKSESRRSPDGRKHWLNWVLVLRGGDAHAIGFVQATVQEDHRAWVAYQVATSHWGRGLATEAVSAMIGHLTSQHAVAHCLATVDQRNARSWRLLERLGFARADAMQAAAMDVQAGDWLYVR